MKGVTSPPPLRVLIVEDDPQIAALHWRLLERAGGFTVLGQAESLRVARAMLRNSCHEYALRSCLADVRAG